MPLLIVWLCTSLLKMGQNEITTPLTGEGNVTEVFKCTAGVVFPCAAVIDDFCCDDAVITQLVKN
jgi:hypothetical protein